MLGCGVYLCCECDKTHHIKNMAKDKKSVVEAPAPTVQTEQTTIAPEQKQPETVTPSAPPTLDELKANSKKAAADYAAALEDDTKTDAEIDLLSMASYKARKAVTDFINNEKAEQAKKELNAKLNDHLSIVDKFEAAYNRNVTVNNALANVPVGERTQAQLDESNEANKVYTDLRAKLIDELTKSFGKTKTIVFAPQGMTGKQLSAKTNGTSANDELTALMQQGKSNEEIEAMFPERYPRTDKGLIHGTIRTARWKFNQMQKQS